MRHHRSNFALFGALLILASAVSTSIVAQDTTNQTIKAFGSLLSAHPGYQRTRDSSRGYYEFIVYVQLRNDGSEPVLILPVFDSSRLSIFLKRKIKFNEGIDLSDERSKTTVVTIPPEKVRDSSGLFDPRPALLKRFDTDQPPPTVITIQPGMYYEFRDTFEIPDTNKRFETDKEVLDYEHDRAGQKFPSFTIEYTFSTKGTGPYDDFLTTLRSRWRKFGNLMIDSDGNFDLRTETILGDRPPANDAVK